MRKFLKLPQLKCERCGNVWIPRVSNVRVCSKCKSPYWDVPKKKSIRQIAHEKREAKKLDKLMDEKETTGSGNRTNMDC